MAYSLTVAGVEREVLIERLNINAPLHNKSTLSAAFLSEDGSLVINLEDEIILTRHGTRLFRGEVSRASLRGQDGPGGDGNDAIIWEVIANDSSWPLDYHVTSETIPAGSTLKEALELLMPAVPELILDPSQVDGPILPTEILFDNTKLRDAFSQLISEAIAADTDGWFLRVTHLQVLEAIAPGDSPAPFDLVEGNGIECDDVESDDRRDDDYATRVIVLGGIVTEVNRAEAFVGDGETDTFTLDYTATGIYGYVTHAGIYETMSIAPAGGATWVFDPSANTIQRVDSGGAGPAGPPALGASVVVTFDGWKQIVGDTGETSPPGRTVVEIVDGLVSTAAANAAAARLLVELSASQKMLTYPTRSHGLQVGDSQSVTTAKRQVPTLTTFYVNEIDITYDGATEGDGLLYRVQVKASQVVKGNFRATYRQWARVGGAGGSSAAAAPSGVSSVGPGGPHLSVQINNNGRFHGVAELDVNTGFSSLMLGPEQESDGDYNLLVGQGHTVN